MPRGALLIAPSADAVSDVSRLLHENDYTLQPAHGVDDAVRALRDDGPDLVICMGSPVTAAEVCRRIRGENFARYIYVMAVLPSGSGHEAAMVLGAGADACLSEPLHAKEFAAWLGAAERILDRDRELSFLTRCDPLTGLLNRRSLFELLEKEFSRADRYRQVLSCAMLDLDDFKQINDTHGHLAGDAVLRAVAGALEKSLRRSEIVCRYGGDEFCVVMPQTGSPGARVCASRCLRSVEDLRVPYQNQVLRITASIGTAERVPGGSDVAALLNMADQALLDAKREGKNRATIG